MDIPQIIALIIVVAFIFVFFSFEVNFTTVNGEKKSLTLFMFFKKDFWDYVLGTKKKTTEEDNNKYVITELPYGTYSFWNFLKID